MVAAGRTHDDAIRCLVIEGGAQLNLRDEVGPFLKTNFFATDDREQGDERALDDAPTTLIEQLERDGADEIVRTKYAGR